MKVLGEKVLYEDTYKTIYTKDSKYYIHYQTGALIDLGDTLEVGEDDAMLAMKSQHDASKVILKYQNLREGWPDVSGCWDIVFKEEPIFENKSFKIFKEKNKFFLQYGTGVAAPKTCSIEISAEDAGLLQNGQINFIYLISKYSRMKKYFRT